MQQVLEYLTSFFFAINRHFKNLKTTFLILSPNHISCLFRIYIINPQLFIFFLHQEQNSTTNKNQPYTLHIKISQFNECCHTIQQQCHYHQKLAKHKDNKQIYRRKPATQTLCYSYPHLPKQKWLIKSKSVFYFFIHHSLILLLSYKHSNKINILTLYFIGDR